MPPAYTARYTFGPFRLDSATRQLSRNSEVVALTPKAFDLLWVLVSRAGHVVSKDELLKLVWPDAFVGEDSLTQNIATLRKALGDSSEQPEYIVTAHRRGYRFAVDVHPVPERTHPPVAEAESGHVRPQANRGGRGAWIAQSIAIGSICALLAGLGVAYRAAPSADRPMRFIVYPPDNTTLASGGVLSPDSRNLAFVAQDLAGKALLWVRALDSITARSLAGTGGAWAPFWSPDGASLAFFAEGKLKKVDVAGGAPQVICSTEGAGTAAGGTWSPEGVILFAERRSGLFSVSTDGGVPAAVTALDPSGQEIGHRWPQFLPDGEHLLYLVESPNPDRRGVYVGRLHSTMRSRVLDSSSSAAVYAEPGYLVFVRDKALMVQAFDVRSLGVTGAPGVIATGVSAPPFMTNGLPFSASAYGVITYGMSGKPDFLAWFDRAGKMLNVIDSPAELHNVSLAPGDKQFAAAGMQSGVWVFDLRRGVGSRLAMDGTLPLWSPDGARVAFASSRAAGIHDLYWRSLDGAHDDVLFRFGKTMFPQGWSRDGRFIVYSINGGATKLDIWLLPMVGDRKPVAFLDTPFNEVDGQVSPNGRWIAYTSDESGSWQVYLQSFPVPGGKRIISTHGGAQPRWRRDGKELFYLAPDHQLIAVAVKDGSTIEFGSPTPLFQMRIRGDLVGTSRNHYDVASDGQRFLVDTTADPADRAAITVFANWAAAVRK